MKKILLSMLAITMAAFTFTSCEDVPEPYEIPGGNVPGGDTPGGNIGEYIYNETVGTDGSASEKPFVDTYTGWAKEGSGAANVTYSGSNASVRSTGLSNSGAYEGASGANIIFFGKSASFIINKISLTAEQTKLHLGFGASSSVQNDNNEYDNSFDESKFIVSLSADGETWTPITYTKNNGDQNKPYWIYATSDFTIKQAIGELYIKFEATINSAIRLDDISLTIGDGGQEIDLGAGSTVTPPTGDATPISIADIVAKMSDDGAIIDATTNRYFDAVVQSNVDCGNYTTNNLCVAEENANKAGQGITLYGSQVDPKTLGLKQGDKVRITLIAGKATAKNYSGLYEITGAISDTWCNIEKTGTTVIIPVTISATEISNLATYQGMTVKVNNATTKENNNWVGTHTFTTGGINFTVYANNACNFANNTIDNTKTGSITGIVTLYKGAAQIAPRSNEDIKDFSIEGGDSPEPPVSDEDGMTSDYIKNNGNSTLPTNAYGSQNVNDENTWYSWTYDGITYQGAKICVADGKNGTGIQMQGNDNDAAKQGFIFNKTAFKSDIQTVTIVFKPIATSKYSPSYSFYAGTIAHPVEKALTAHSTNSIEGDYKVYTEVFDLSSNNCKYFTISNNKVGALYIDKIIVTLK